MPRRTNATDPLAKAKAKVGRPPSTGTRQSAKTVSVSTQEPTRRVAKRAGSQGTQPRINPDDAIGRPKRRRPRNAQAVKPAVSRSDAAQIALDNETIELKHLDPGRDADLEATKNHLQTLQPITLPAPQVSRRRPTVMSPADEIAHLAGVLIGAAILALFGIPSIGLAILAGYLIGRLPSWLNK